MKYFLIFMFGVSVYSQVEIKINTLNSVDISPDKRKFTIDYQLTNTQNTEIKFFLLPNSLIANSASSMTLFPVYKIYVNGVFEDVDGPFYERFFNEHSELDFIINKEELAKKMEVFIKNAKEEQRIILENYTKNGGTNTDEGWIYSNQKLVQSIITLQPKETKNFQINTVWNKERYFRVDDNEFYLDENQNYEFQLSLYLDKTNRKSKLSEEEFLSILNDTNFIEGRFFSNKVKIDFGEY